MAGSTIAAVVGTVVSVGMSVAGSVMGGSSSDQANAQLQAQMSAQQLQWKEFQQAQQNMAPWVQSGASNLNRLNTAMQTGGPLDPMAQYTMQNYLASPEYQVMQQQMQQSTGATQAGAAAAGNYGSGNMANALQRNAANIGMQGYTTGLQDWQNQRNTGYNMLAGLANPQAAQQISQMGINTGQNIGNQQMQLGANLANTMQQGYQNQQNAYGNISNQLMGAYGAYQQNQMYQNYQDGGGYSGMWGADTSLSSSFPQPTLNVGSGGYTPDLGSWGD